mmetsp:Transcript_6767/g.9555  ORF Transcript_6767/g.9555 Transcript_6767/m.9555 type:complete len:97 (-) Transcript_6767:183-473(-)
MLVRDLPTSMNYERDTAGREALQAFLRDNIDIDQLKEALAGTANTSIKNTRTQDATRPKKKVRFACPVVQQIQIIGPSVEAVYEMAKDKKSRCWYQ